MEEQPNKYQGTWVIVSTSTRRFIGRVAKMNNNEVSLESVLDSAQLFGSRYFTLKPVFDYMMPLGQHREASGEVVVGRRPMVMPLDITEGVCPVHVMTNNVNDVIFAHEMSTGDQRNFFGLLEDFARQQAEARAASAGLHLPTKPSGGLIAPGR